jgi:hypothetical protein
MFYFVIDYECFDNNVIKEIGIATQYFDVGFALKPPFPFERLSSASQAQNNFLTKNIHMICWNSGVLDYRNLQELLSQFRHLDAVYYVKGLEKVRVLGALLPGVVIRNLEDLGCPRYSQVFKDLELGQKLLDYSGKQSSWTFGCCKNYPISHNNYQFNHCAQKKAKVFARWVEVNVLEKQKEQTTNYHMYEEVL